MLAMVALHAFLPGPRLVVSPWRWAGAGLMLVGLALILHCAGLFRRAGTPLRPFEPSTALVTTGPYRVTRNPIYLAMVVALVGLGALLGSLVPLAVIPVFIVLIDRGFIQHEETMMAATFGDAYAAYRARVRRWL